MYPSDFEAADAVFTPDRGPLFLGLPPLVALGLALLIAGLAAFMFLLGRRQAERSGGHDAERAPDDIHRAILIVSRAAMAASSDELSARARALRAAVDDHLGAVLAVAKGVAGPVKALDEALKGEVREAPPTAPEDHGAPGRGHGPHPGPGPLPAGVPPVTVTQIFVGGVTAPAQPPPHDDHNGDHDRDHKPDRRKPEPKPETRPMTGPEQVEALSKAVRAFHDHWSRGPERIRELRDARRALSRRPPTAALIAPDGPASQRR